jgi:hypothetical protein
MSLSLHAGKKLVHFLLQPSLSAILARPPTRASLLLVPLGTTSLLFPKDLNIAEAYPLSFLSACEKARTLLLV